MLNLVVGTEENTTIVVSVSIVGIQFYCFGIIYNRTTTIAPIAVSNAAIEIGFCIIGFTCPIALV